MLMLERAAETVNPSECNDPAVLLACSLGSDSCPAACRADEETTVDENGNKVVVKSGDLSITATATEGKKVILGGATSYLDTINLKASEAITLNSITLERYGFSSYADIDAIWLENADGVQITNEKSLSSSKDTVTLNLKKEYKELNAEDTVVIAIRTVNPTPATPGTSVGFKVKDVDSSAKNVDLSSYSPYLYDMIKYTGSDVTITPKGRDTVYHYNSEESYEIARFQVRASNSAISVNGFTLNNSSATGTPLDLDKYVKDVSISLGDGTEVKNVKYTANKDNELVISFDTVEVEINKSIVFVVEASFVDFDQFWNVIELMIDWSNDIKAVESKNQVNATVKDSAGNAPTTLNHITMKKYEFLGGKVEISNTKLAENIDSAAGSSDVIVGKGKISVPETIKLSNFTFTISTDNGAINADDAVESFTIIAAGDEYDATKAATSAQSMVYTFSNVTIDDSWEVEFVIDLKNNTSAITLDGTKLTIAWSFDKNSFNGARYEDSRKPMTPNTDVAGSISLSNIRIQAAKWSLTNNSTKDVEFLKSQTARKTIFDGTYAAQKQDVYLNAFAVLETNSARTAARDITYYLSVDGKEVASFDFVPYSGSYVANNYVKTNGSSFSDAIVKQGEKVSIKLEANVNDNNEETFTPQLVVIWTDKDWNDAGVASEYTAKIKVVEAGTVTVSESPDTNAKSVVVNDTNINLAKFIVKSSKNTDGMTLDSFILSPVAGKNTITSVATDNIRIRVNGSEVANGDYVVCDGVSTASSCTTADTGVIKVSSLSEDITTAWIDVEVILKKPVAGDNGKIFNYKLTKVNSSTPNTEFSKLIVASLASIKAQENRGDSSTKFTFSVEKDSNDTAVTKLQLYVKDAAGNYKKVWEALDTVEEGATIEIANGTNVQFIEAIVWGGTAADGGSTLTSSDGWVVVTKDAYRDFFRVGDSYAQIFRTK